MTQGLILAEADEFCGMSGQHPSAGTSSVPDADWILDFPLSQQQLLTRLSHQ